MHWILRINKCKHCTLFASAYFQMNGTHKRPLFQPPGLCAVPSRGPAVALPPGCTQRPNKTSRRISRSENGHQGHHLHRPSATYTQGCAIRVALLVPADQRLTVPTVYLHIRPHLTGTSQHLTGSCSRVSWACGPALPRAHPEERGRCSLDTALLLSQVGAGSGARAASGHPSAHLSSFPESGSVCLGRQAP